MPACGLFLWQCEGKSAAPARMTEFGPPTSIVRDSSRMDGGSKLDLPEVLSGARVEGDKVFAGVTSEHQATSGQERGTTRGREVLELPRPLAGVPFSSLLIADCSAKRRQGHQRFMWLADNIFAPEEFAA
jgi:hypothetical protein